MSIEPRALLLLLNWMSPAFPTGGFAYSHGLETAIADGRLRDRAGFVQWIDALLRAGSGWNDAVLFSCCWSEEEGELNGLALALASSAERHMETVELGRAFASAAAVWTDRPPGGAAFAYPVAAGLLCRGMGIPRQQALIAFLQGFCASLVSVGVRLVPLGQTQGLAALRDLSGPIARTAERAMDATLDDLGSHCLAAEIAAMRHEHLEPRIFRS